MQKEPRALNRCPDQDQSQSVTALKEVIWSGFRECIGSEKQKDLKDCEEVNIDDTEMGEAVGVLCKLSTFEGRLRAFECRLTGPDRFRAGRRARERANAKGSCRGSTKYTVQKEQYGLDNKKRVSKIRRSSLDCR